MTDTVTINAENYIDLMTFTVRVGRLIGSAPDASREQVLLDIERLVAKAYPPVECPECAADLTGDPIPQDQRWMFGGAVHFDQRIAETDWLVDRVVSYRCPICEAWWPR